MLFNNNDRQTLEIMESLKYHPESSCGASKMQYKKEMTRTSLYIFIILCSLLISPTISQEGNDLCTDPDCTCDSQPGEPDLIDVVCTCSPKKVNIFINVS